MADEPKTADALQTLQQQAAEAEVALRTQFIVALKTCRWPERKFLRALMKSPGNAYEAGRQAGIGKASVWKYQREPRVVLVRQLIDDILLLELGVSMFTQQREYWRQGYAKLRDAYYPRGHPQQGTLKPPHEWDDDLAAAIQEMSYDKDGNPTVKMHAKGPALGALDKLRNLGPAQRLEVTGKDGEPLNSAPAVMVVPGMVTEAGWAAAASAQQQHLAEAEGKFVEPSREPEKK